MRDTRQVFWGILTALVSIALLFGVLSLSLVEGNIRLPTSTPPSTITLTWQPSPSLVNFPTPLPPIITLTQQSSPSLFDSPTPLPPTWTSTWTLTWTPTRTPTWTPTRTPSWTLTWTPTRIPAYTSVPCGPPPTWVIYIVQHSDTLYHLGQVYGIPYTEIMRANCLTSINIRTGQQLYVPPWATRTPSPTFTGIPTDTPSSTPVPPTGTPVTPTDTPVTPTDTPVTPTDTPVTPTEATTP